MEEQKNIERIIDLKEIFKTLKSKRKAFYKVWAVVFVLSCIWVLPKPKYYTCEVKLAPEFSGATSRSSLASIASSFGLNLGNVISQDAIYPMLYPELIESPEFVVGLLDIKVETFDGNVKTDYYTYLKDHQKRNWLTAPIADGIGWCFSLFSSDEDPVGSDEPTPVIQSFNMSKKDHQLVERIMKNIKCSVDKKTSVITISVKDQDRMVCAIMADSVRNHLQNFILNYRTKKARLDAEHYQQLVDSARIAYENALLEYSIYRDSHKYVKEFTVSEEGERLKKNLDLKYTSYNAFNTQLTAAMAKVQEETPSFTTLKSASIPYKAAGPNRKLFVIGMLLISTLITSLWLSRKQIF